jgi:hypothetical protein
MNNNNYYQLFGISKHYTLEEYLALCHFDESMTPLLLPPTLLLDVPGLQLSPITVVRHLAESLKRRELVSLAAL